MNELTSLQRKLVYLGGVILLLIPIMWLGRPPQPAPGGRTEAGSGGMLARLRDENQLGESNLGNVDPASSTMNLLLLGFRGIATSVLWMDAQDQQKAKDWAALRATTDSIILLQPHFLKVWHFQGWNLAYNVSAEWDLVTDRYYWVKEGIKFFMRGKERNEKYPELYWYIGDSMGKKIGRSDEWKQFREFYRNDPDKTRFRDGPDPQLNPENRDNYLVAKSWFQDANRILDTYPNNKQHIMAEILYRSYPERAQIDYATARQRDGDFDEVTREAWAEAFREWTTRYGMIEFEPVPGVMIKLEITDEELEKIKKDDELRDPALGRVANWIKSQQDMTNYRFWRTRTQVESEPTMAEAHRDLYEGERLAKAADYSAAQDLLYSGMQKFEKMLDQYPDLKDDDGTIEEGMMAQLFWRDCLDIDDEKPSESEGYPLQEMWHARQNRLPNLTTEFQRRKRATR